MDNNTSKKIQVIISLTGRFHAFDLARELAKKNYLKKLITTYPKFFVKKFEVPEDFVISEIFLELINRTKKYLPKSLDNSISNFIKVIHDFNTSRHLNETNVFIGWSGKSIKSILKAKRRGIITILERGSSHIKFQNNLLKSEYSNFNLPFNENQTNIDKELVEYENTDFISVPSKFVYNSFLEMGVDKNKLLLNPYGVDTENFPAVADSKNKEFTVIFVGQATIRKGFHYLLEALNDIGPKVKLLHVGHFHEEMKDFRNKFPNVCAEYLGVRPQKELYKYYNKAHAMILPSLEEGLAMVQLQGMSCGLPLICTHNTGGEDIITDGVDGFVIPVRSPEKIKEKVLFLFENQNRCHSMGQLAREKILKNFTWQCYGERYIKNIEKILKSNES